MQIINLRDNWSFYEGGNQAEEKSKQQVNEGPNYHQGQTNPSKRIEEILKYIDKKHKWYYYFDYKSIINLQ